MNAIYKGSLKLELMRAQDALDKALKQATERISQMTDLEKLDLGREGTEFLDEVTKASDWVDDVKRRLRACGVAA